jgi:hypothetical protein
MRAIKGRIVKRQLHLAALAAAFGVAACSSAQVTSATQNAVAAGQLFCTMATPTGQVVVALADASGVPVVVTNMAQAWVAAACAVIGGIPVSPPTNEASVPVEAANVPPPVATGTSG